MQTLYCSGVRWLRRSSFGTVVRSFTAALVLAVSFGFASSAQLQRAATESDAAARIEKASGLAGRRFIRFRKFKGRAETLSVQAFHSFDLDLEPGATPGIFPDAAGDDRDGENRREH